MFKRAVILAGGKGTRLLPYTVVFPKPLMPVGDYPILEVIIRQLAKQGFHRITFAVNHQAELIRSFFGSGIKWGVKIDYSLEDKALGTIGPLCLIKDLPENFLVMNGDILTDLNFTRFYKKHCLQKNLFTICSHARTHTLDYGLLNINKNGVLTNFQEKPKTTFQVSMGIYMLNKKVLHYVPKGKPYGFDDLLKKLIKDNKIVNVDLFKGIWYDIGRPDDFAVAADTFQKQKAKILGE